MMQAATKITVSGYDRKFAKDHAFLKWAMDLDALIEEWGAEHGGHPYGGHISKTTGLSCWRGYYDDGYSPADAFAEDRTHRGWP